MNTYYVGLTLLLEVSEVSSVYKWLLAPFDDYESI